MSESMTEGDVTGRVSDEKQLCPDCRTPAALVVACGSDHCPVRRARAVERLTQRVAKVETQAAQIDSLTSALSAAQERATVAERELVSVRSQRDALTARVEAMEAALRIAATAELYDPATGIIDADVLDIVQSEARNALAALPPEMGADRG